jgi:hypothetical protein
MRATSSVLSYCTLCAIPELLKIKELAELLDKKPGSNSPAIEKIALWIFEAGLFESKKCIHVSIDSHGLWSKFLGGCRCSGSAGHF